MARGQQLARVRLQAQQCRQTQLHAQGPLLNLQAGQVVPVAQGPDSAAGDWLITQLSLQSHRDGHLHTTFEACPADQPWRPARVTPRPAVHGLLAAHIHQGQPAAHLDQAGHYLVRYPWQDDPASARLRMSQTHAGPSYGNQPCRPHQASGLALRQAQAVHWTPCVRAQLPSKITPKSG